MSKQVKFYAFVLAIFLIGQASFGQTLDELIGKAEKMQQAGDLEGAAKIMEQAVQKFPEQSNAYSYLGFYRGIQAGRTQNYMEAGLLIGTSFEMLDKAVALDPNNPMARFHRGLMSVKVPPMMGKLADGIADLEQLVALQPKSNAISNDLVAKACDLLGEAYQKKQETDKAIAAYKKVINVAPGTDLAKKAEKQISDLTQPQVTESAEPKLYSTQDVEKMEKKLTAEPDNPEVLTQLGKAYNDTRQYDKAVPVLEKALQKDSTLVMAYKQLLQALSQQAGAGYDQRIHADTDFRTNLAFKVAKIADQAVALAPQDLELRLIRGTIGVSMPFFVGKLDQGIADLILVKDGKAPKALQAEATYWLGFAHQKKATTYWIKVISDYPKTEASKFAFRSMRPAISHFDPSQHQPPYVVVDFILGFQDELEPQTAVWLEDAGGKFVKTLYVSGFSGFAREKQVNLSDWAAASKFSDADAVTGASINVGHHVYVWDLKDHQGKAVKPGDYVVKVEVAYWPSMQYQAVSAKVNVGKQSSRVVVQEGNLIPFLEVQYKK